MAVDLTSYFKLMVAKKASDLFFVVGAPLQIKIEGDVQPVDQNTLTAEQVSAIAAAIMNEEQKKKFAETMELNLGLALENIGRYRINIFRQRGDVAIVMRFIKEVIPTIAELNLPPALSAIMGEERGMVLLVGATGSGKSTSLASMIDFRNANQTGHILTIEDPIEYVYQHKKSIVTQREVGIDTLSYENALENAMRESPNVILIGEIRERNTMKHAIAYSETGHLCLSTLHANSANQAIDRIINFFPDDAKKQLLLDLALNLRAIISQRLIPGVNNIRVPAVEILLNSSYVADLILKGKTDEIKEVMERSTEQGMQTFDQSLFSLYQAGKITKENAIHYADSRNNVRLKIRLLEGVKGGGDDLSLAAED